MSATGHHVLSFRAMLIMLTATDARTERARTAEANGFEGIVEFVIQAFERAGRLLRI
jgi:hypothetical protein